MDYKGEEWEAMVGGARNRRHVKLIGTLHYFYF
jgi:hypothetical protein